jgi:chromosome partitioning protein
MAVTETCSICSSSFDMQFRYQMEERDGAFLFFCSQACLQRSHTAGSAAYVTCDACSKGFHVELVTNVVYVKGHRKYACSSGCRAQLAREAEGVRLGEVAAANAVEIPNIAPVADTPLQVSASADHGPLAAGAAELKSQPASPAARAACQSQHKRLPHVIAVFNHKGGTGKTTTSVSLAAGLAKRGRQVLLVDTDAQGNVAVSLDIKAQRSLYHVLVMGLAVSEAAVRVRDHLDLVPANESLAAAELYLAGRQQRDRVLAKRLEGAVAAYDYVVLDCSPSLSLMNQNALVFADSVLVPVACDYLSLVGVRQVIRTVKNVNQLLHHPVQIWGVLPTFYDARARICREALETLRSHFGTRCLPPIRAAMKVKEAPAQAQTIFEYAPGSAAAEDYDGLVGAVLGTGVSEQFDAAASA